MTLSADSVVYSKLSTPGLKKPIEVYKASRRSKNIHVLINGGMHGNETLSPEFVKWVKARYLSGTSELNKLKFDFSIDFLPVLNREGFEKKNRYNFRGVNLNRNFPVLWGISRENPGLSPASEPETKAIISLFETRKYDVAIDIHGYVNWIVGPTSPELVEYLTKSEISKHHKHDHKEWTSSLKENLSSLNGYEFKTAGGLGDGGAFEDYAYWGAGAKTFCLEIHSRAKDAKHKLAEYKSYEIYIGKMIQKAHKMKNATNVASN